MLKPEHWAWVRKLFTRGTNSDIDPNMLGEGVFTDSLNMRSSSPSGSSGALKRIGGEAVVYTGTEPGAASYQCLGAVSINGRLVTFWANTDPQFAPLIQIDGITSAMSPLIPYTWDHPHQYAVVERCRGGVIYPVDDNADPLFWDIQAMVDAQGTGTYFAGFTLDLVSVGLNAPPTYPVYDPTEPIVDLQSPVGLPVGQYSYAIRYVTLNGDRTNWGPESPLIPVPAKYAPEVTNNGVGSNQPGGRTFGGQPLSLVPTPYGVKMNFRVDNPYGYESVEIKRRAFALGGGVNGIGEETVVARILLFPGQVQMLVYTDPVQSNVTEIVPPSESDTIFISIRRPKAVEYANQRLTYANFETDGQPTGITFTSMSSGVITSITRKLTKVIDGVEIPDGYSNPYQAAYNKSAQRGERYGYCLQAWNGALGKFYALPIPGAENYQHPNQRDIKGPNGAWPGATNPAGWGAESDLYSDDRCFASTVDVNETAPNTAEGPVGRTFAIMSQGRGTKTDLVNIVNVALPTPGQPIPSTVGRWSPAFTQYSVVIPPEVTSTFVADFITVPNSLGYKPWDPRNNQADGSGYNIPPNTSRLTSAAGTGGGIFYNTIAPTGFVDQSLAFNPADSYGKIFAPTYHSLGVLFGGFENIPASVNAISIGRTKPAGRVVMQGLGSYRMSQGSTSGPATKSTQGVNAFFPDYAAGLVDQATVDDIRQNPGKYKVQVQCGLGFYNETYGYTGADVVDYWPGTCTGAYLADMMMYARIMQDGDWDNGIGSTCGKVNVGEPGPGGMGYQPIPGNAPPGNYVGFDKWRSNLIMDTNTNPNSATYSYFQQGDQGQFGNLPTGNKLFDITLFEPGTTGRENFFHLQVLQAFYAPACGDINDGGSVHTAFNDPIVTAFHQPWFVINIVKDAAEVPDANQQIYIPTGFNMAMRSCIGLYTSTGIQDFQLLDDPEFYNSVGFLGTDFRYAYVTPVGLPEQRYLCVTNNTSITVATILNDIATLGFWTAPDGLPVHGLYDSTAIVATRYLQFGNYPTIPPIGSRIVVKYPEGTPVRVFGHDTTIGPNTHASIDQFAVRDDIDNGNTPPFVVSGLPLPYAGFGMNPRYFMPEKQNQTEEQININFLISIRQMCILWDAESKIQPAMYVNNNSTPEALADRSQMFPFIHYINRPYNFDGGDQNGVPTAFFSGYQSDYPLEWTINQFGGLRFLPGVNLDYARQPDPDFVGLAQAGYQDKTDYCTGMAPSSVFAVTQQDSPGLRTFPPQLLHVLSEETGEIKMIASLTDGQIGQNMFFWTHNGWGYVLTNKRVLTGVDGGVIGTQTVENYWGDEVFKSRVTGMPYEMWRLAAKGNAPMSPQSGSPLADTVFWADKNGVYRLIGTQFYPIAEDKWLRQLLPFLTTGTDGFEQNIQAVYDTTKHEYLIGPKATSEAGYPADTVFVYSTKRGEWGGTYGHTFDKFVVHNTRLYGMRDLQTFILDGSTFTQNGATIVGFGETVWAPEPGIRYEATAFRTHPTKPDRIEVYDSQHNLIFYTDQATQEALTPGSGARWILRIDGWQALMGRANPDLDPDRKRLQDELFYVRFIYNTGGEKVMTDGQLQLKRLI